MSLLIFKQRYTTYSYMPLTQRVCLGKQEDSIVSSDGQLWSMALTTCSHCIRIHQPNQLKTWALSKYFYVFNFIVDFFETDMYNQTLTRCNHCNCTKMHQPDEDLFFYFLSYFYTTLGLGKSKVVKMVCEEKIRYMVQRLQQNLFHKLNFQNK